EAAGNEVLLQPRGDRRVRPAQALRLPNRVRTAGEELPGRRRADASGRWHSHPLVVALRTHCSRHRPFHALVPGRHRRRPDSAARGVRAEDGVLTLVDGDLEVAFLALDVEPVAALFEPVQAQVDDGVADTQVLEADLTEPERQPRPKGETTMGGVRLQAEERRDEV